MAAFVVLGPSAGAHDFWIEPSSYAPAQGSVLRVRLRVGQHFEGDLLPRQDDLIDRFDVETPARRVPIAGVDGTDPAGLLRIESPGTYVLSYQSRGSRVELPADTFERYLTEEGLERVIEQRATHGASGRAGRERFIRCAKSLVVVPGSSARQPAAPSGLTLEIVPRVDPARLRGGDPLPVTLLFRGRPLAGAFIRVLAKGDPLRGSAQRTDRSGQATLVLAGSGPYLVKAVWMEAVPAGSDVDWQSWWATFDFDLVGTP